jgi:protein-tyrosine phosphatase
MNWIDDHVAIGNYLDAQDVNLLRASAIASVLSLDGSLGPGDAERLGVRAVVAMRLIDGAGNDVRLFRLAVATLDELVRVSAPVLVQCHAGRSRSAAVVAGYLMRARGIEAADAIAHIATRRPIAVAEALEALLERLR